MMHIQTQALPDGRCVYRIQNLIVTEDELQPRPDATPYVHELLLHIAAGLCAQADRTPDHDHRQADMVVVPDRQMAPAMETVLACLWIPGRGRCFWATWGHAEGARLKTLHDGVSGATGAAPEL